MVLPPQGINEVAFNRKATEEPQAQIDSNKLPTIMLNSYKSARYVDDLINAGHSAKNESLVNYLNNLSTLLHHACLFPGLVAATTCKALAVSMTQPHLLLGKGTANVNTGFMFYKFMVNYERYSNSGNTVHNSLSYADTCGAKSA